MGAILLNGCRIGTGSIVAAGALVPEGMVVPPGSMVMGMPAKVRRPLTAEEDASISGTPTTTCAIASTSRPIDHPIEHRA